MIDRVLVFTPTYRLEPETVTAVRNQDYRGRWDWLLTFDNPHPVKPDRGKANILMNYQKGRQALLDGGYDAMWVVESDIIPPPDALTRLVKVVNDGHDLAYGHYLYRQPWPKTKVSNVSEFNAGDYNGRARNRGQPWRGRPFPTEGVTRCSGSGLGCVLITRPVLEEVDFRHTDRGAHCDTYFSKDVWYAYKWSQAVDWSVKCGHKRPEGDVIWPE